MPQQKEEKTAQSNNNQELDEQSLKRVVEALIFASDKPLSIQQIRDIVEDENVDARVIRRLINELIEQYSKSQVSFGITEIAGGFQFSTDSAYGRWIKKLYNIKQKDYLSGPGLETLAIIAYQQPATKTDIEQIRGVNVDGVVDSLLQKGLIRVAGRKEVVGRPFLYGTTSLFLQYFGLNSLQELPALPEFQKADLKFQKKDKDSLVEIPSGETDPKGTTENDKGSVPESKAGPIDGEKDGEVKEVTQKDRRD